MQRLIPLILVSAIALAACGGGDDDGGGDESLAKGASDTAPTLEQVHQAVDEHPLSEDCKKLVAEVTKPAGDGVNEESQVLCDDFGVALLTTFPSRAELEQYDEDEAFPPPIPYVVGGTVRVTFDSSLLPGGYEQLDQRREGFRDIAERLVELCDCGEAREPKESDALPPVG